MSLIQRPSMKAVPIDRSGPTTCVPEVHKHCDKCGKADQTVIETKPVNGPPWRPLCSDCIAKVLRVQAVVKAVQALEGGCE